MDTEDTICDYLREEVFPQLIPPPHGEIEIIRLNGEKPVFLCIADRKKLMVVAKFFNIQSISPEEALLEADKEYLNLKLLRERFGMSGDTDKVAAPLGEKKVSDALLVTEAVQGYTLDYYIAKAAYEQNSEELFKNLGYLARFFVRLHSASETENAIRVELVKWYLDKLLNSLGSLGSFYRNAIEEYLSKWWSKTEIFTSDREVIVHGDATPTNFIFSNGNVTGIDLEKMNWADRCWDLGFISAELKHHFMWRTGNGWGAEPFIGHFLWEYAVNYGNDIDFFHTVTQKLPLYMAIGLLRISRNNWLDESYRKCLVTEAHQCLKYGL